MFSIWQVVLIASLFGAFVGWALLAFKDLHPVVRYSLAAVGGVGAGFVLFKMLFGNS
jgi:hypothetical protein